MSLVIGYDLGGTSMSAGLVDETGKILEQKEVDTLPHQSLPETLERVKSVIVDLIALAKGRSQTVTGLGLGMAGLINPVDGIVHIAPNLPAWKEVPLVRELEKTFALPVVIDNDVRAAAMGEMHYGAGRGTQNLICITVGTGIGSAIVINGDLYRGSGYTAGELGHITVVPQGGLVCGCGNQGCLEAVAGTQGILTLAHRLMERGFCPILAQSVQENRGKLTPRLISEAAQAGDAGAQQVWKEVGEWIGLVLASVVNLLNPERIIIGGGIAQAREFLFTPIRQTIQRHAFKAPASQVQVVPAELGPDAGMIGAAVLCRLKAKIPNGR